MEFKGSQGKWIIDNGIGVTSVNSKRFPAGIDSIATVRNQFHNDETKANALLISKAPELLEELENKLIFIEELVMLIPSQEWTESFRDKYNKEMHKLEKLIKETTEL